MAGNHAGMVKYPSIFNETRVGAFTCRNRVKYAACSVSNFNTRDGFITDREYARMEVIARTGAGMITNQGAYPDADGAGKAYYRQLSIADDKHIAGFRKIADSIHGARGKQVTIVEVGKRLGEDVIATFKWRHAAWVRELQIQTLVNAQAKEITEEGVRVEEKDGSERLVPATP